MDAESKPARKDSVNLLLMLFIAMALLFAALAGAVIGHSPVQDGSESIWFDGRVPLLFACIGITLLMVGLTAQYRSSH